MDHGQRIVESILEARQDRRPLNIAGAGSKRSWLPDVSGEMLAMTEHTGIVAYDPAELVVTVNAGTAIRDLMAELAHAEQTLAFEPPQFYGSGTVGGMVSTGLCGPARPWAGSVRDAVLGIEMVNGLGQRLKFGGQVMKNVAGYDVSRLVAGAYGSLGALLQVSLRVQPVREHNLTLEFELDAEQAKQKCRQLAQRDLPVTASWWSAGQLSLRLSGAEAGVVQAVRELGGEQINADGLWSDVRDHNLAFFKLSSPGGVDRTGKLLWRVVVPPAAPLPRIEPDKMPQLAADALALESTLR